MEMKATFGAGCFWCIEACFNDIEGVTAVMPGYSGGEESTANYWDVCSGTSGHAEVARITFDSEVVSFEKLLELFWFVHDPTQLNRQGNDCGTQYRSAIFYHDENQMELAKRYKKKLTDEKVWDAPVVTEISALKNFFPAEENHQNYYQNNQEGLYCQAIVRPKVEKFRKVFAELLK
ncbi:MAG: peptide-methionine (S)-S-oxide reductase MsrA [Crocinitomicaceae bacterium]|nr:peptide-methionine (S)-S-oxide reductase MsrA [Crocinitomicaceae bacterium]